MPSRRILQYAVVLRDDEVIDEERQEVSIYFADMLFCASHKISMRMQYFFCLNFFIQQPQSSHMFQGYLD